MPLDARRRLAAAYREAVPDGRVVHFKAGLVGPTRAEARERAAGFVQDYARRYLDVAVGGPDTAGFDEALDRLDFAVGTADDVAERMRAWVEPFDPRDAVAIQFGGPGVRREHVLDALELLAPRIPELAG
jgi:alkanesulfonate monooxygenase SsuD/methylene tetrahydromethanopterin reductase-like flavin-dependent oxidoreductase (luciferase family)